MTLSQLTISGTALLMMTLVVGGCTPTKIAKDGDSEQEARSEAARCGYEASHDIYARLECLRISLEAMMPPNSRLVSDAYWSARRASYSAPQSGR